MPAVEAKGWMTSWVAGCLIVFLILGGCAGADSGQASREGREGGSGRVVILCPVSGDGVGIPRQALSSRYQGKKYYFCCEKCKEEFDRDPEKYLGR